MSNILKLLCKIGVRLNLRRLQGLWELHSLGVKRYNLDQSLYVPMNCFEIFMKYLIALLFSTSAFSQIADLDYCGMSKSTRELRCFLVSLRVVVLILVVPVDLIEMLKMKWIIGVSIKVNTCS